MRTLQEIFNLAYKGLESQGWQKSVTSKARCAYLTDKGLKCAIGHAIPEIESYRQKNWFEKKVTFIPPKVLDTSATICSIEQLQFAHDLADSHEDCKARLEEFAKKYQLTLPN